MADDTIRFLKHQNDTTRVTDILKQFARLSGFKLRKTKSLGIGDVDERFLNIPFEIVDTIKILGISFAKDKMSIGRSKVIRKIV